jgi:hypothetical protein
MALDPTLQRFAFEPVGQEMDKARASRGATAVAYRIS